MRGLLVVLLSTSACGFSVNGGSNETPDARRDAVDGRDDLDGDTPEPDMAVVDNVVCRGKYRRVCTPMPTQSMNVNSGMTVGYDTKVGSASCLSSVSSETMTSTVGDVCLIAATTITIDGSLRGFGSRPLVLFASQSVTINGTGEIDVATRQNGVGDRGAGGRDSCTPSTAATGQSGGGAGGSYGSGGGTGGTGTGSSIGAIPQAAVNAGELVGGCNGSAGSTNALIDAGAGGIGGGAIMIIAPQITINNNINASGARGIGGNNRAGGGGGGSGGMIVLDTDTLSINGNASLWAQGAGGGEGGGNNVKGNNGMNPAVAGTAAAGGTNGSNGAAGGAGAVSLTTGALNGSTSANDGGGGGGGGVGFIITTAMNITDSGESFPTLVKLTIP